MRVAEARNLMTSMFVAAKTAIKPGSTLNTCPKLGYLIINDPREQTKVEVDKFLPMIRVGDKILTTRCSTEYIDGLFPECDIIRGINNKLRGEFDAGFIGLLELAALKITMFAQSTHLGSENGPNGYVYARRDMSATSRGRYDHLDGERFLTFALGQESAGFIECTSEDLFAKLAQLGAASWDKDIIDVC